MARADGAFAFGKSGHTWSSGSAYNYATPEEASNWAMTRCRSRKEAPDACKIIATIPTTNGRCFAIAVQQDDNGYGWSTAATVPNAEKRAMERCAGLRKKERPTYPAAVVAVTQGDFGDSHFNSPTHHGTEAERGAAVVRGFNAAFRVGKTLAQAIEESTNYVLTL